MSTLPYGSFPRPRNILRDSTPVEVDLSTGWFTSKEGVKLFQLSNDLEEFDRRELAETLKYHLNRRDLW